MAGLLALRLDRSSLGYEWWAVVSLFGRGNVPSAVLLALLDGDVTTRHFREEAAKRAVDPAVLDRLRRDRSGRVRAAADGERVR